MRSIQVGRLLFTVCAFALWAAAPARAELVTLQFTGTIAFHEGDQDLAIRALFPVGGGASWLLSYESTLAESDLFPGPDDPTLGFYESTGIGWNGVVAGHEYGLWPDARQRVFVRRDGPGLSFDNSIGATSTRGAIAGPLVGPGSGWFGQAFDFSVAWAGSPAFSSDSLPTTVPAGAPHGSFLLYLHSQCLTGVPCPERQVQVHGTVSSVARVPEPETLILLTLGVLAGFTGHRRRYGPVRRMRS